MSSIYDEMEALKAKHNNMEVIKAKYNARIECWRDTQNLAQSMSRPPPSMKITFEPQQDLQAEQYETGISVQDIDCIDCALTKLQEGYRPVVLNLADPSYPGGQVDAGAITQEESLFRRTNLCQTLRLRPGLYPINTAEAILSRQIRVLKTAEADGWNLMEGPPQYLDFISCPGIISPQIIDGRLTRLDADIYRSKVELILQAAARNKNDMVVLGALGCGAFRGPAGHIAEIFKDVLEAGFSTVFQQVIFAILRPDDEQRRVHDRAFQAFTEVFAH